MIAVNNSRTLWELPDRAGPHRWLGMEGTGVFLSGPLFTSVSLALPTPPSFLSSCSVYKATEPFPNVVEYGFHFSVRLLKHSENWNAS